MKGYQLTKAFWAEAATNEAMQINCKSHHLALYTWICELRNRVQMNQPEREVLDLPVQYTMEMCFIGSAHTLTKAVDELAEWGVIEVLSRIKGQGTKIKFSIAYMQKHCNCSANEVQLECKSDAIAVQPIQTDKTVQTDKTKEEGTSPRKGNKAVPDSPPPLQLPAFAGPSFLTAWNLLLTGKKWKDKTTNALQISLNKLARYDEPFAIELINTAIEKDWQGLVYDNTETLWQQHRQAPVENQPPAEPSKTYQDLLRPEFRDQPLPTPHFQFKNVYS